VRENEHKIRIYFGRRITGCLHTCIDEFITKISQKEEEKMDRRKFSVFMVFVLALVALPWGVGQVYAQSQQVPAPLHCEEGQMRCITNADRAEAAVRARAARESEQGGLASPLAAPRDLAGGAIPLDQLYFGIYPNYANSPTGIQKFVDTLPGLNAPNTIGQQIPIAVPDKLTFPGSDYYEISVREYRERMHTFFPAVSGNTGGTLLRGYVQTNNGTNVAGNLNDVAPAPIHYLGPLILAQKDRPVRIKFKNELPPTSAGGNLFIPTDITYMGAGMGPLDSNGLPCDPALPGANCANYSQNRAVIHLHGGNTPWISDGTPHQWTVPATEVTPFPKGASVGYVPDMWFDASGNLITGCAGQLTCATAGATNNPGPGSLTHYYPNQQSARLMFYHDHALGLTRLNVYAGMAAGFLLTDPVETTLINGGNIVYTPPGGSPVTVPVATGTVPDLGTPLIIQDKTFVDATKIAAQDPTWIWGTNPGGAPVTGDLWFPHVYMPNQNPADLSGANPVGRWDYGPWFWPPVTTVQNGPVPCGAPGQTCPGTPNPSGVPESFMDTPIVNGTAYPTLTVPPKAVRFRILNASNDRTVNLQIYYACGSGPTPSANAVCAANDTEVAMVPATPHQTCSATVTGNCICDGTFSPPGCFPIPIPPALPECAPGVTIGSPNYVTTSLVPNVTNPATGCWPDTWPTDGRAGGVPDPLRVGPSFIQIGTEGGFLPAPTVIDNTPIGYEYFRRSITVLNVSNKSVFLGPAERADVIIDFSAVPVGSKLILYNDAPAPVPAFDTRNDYYTGDPDQSMVTGDGTGGAPTTLPGFGPNIRTVMQIVVSGTAGPGANMAGLNTAIPAAFAASQPVPTVPESTYPAPYTAAADTYSRIQDTSLTFTQFGSATPVTMPLKSKAIHELFTLDYGRMNALLGTELPFTNFLTQTTIPLAYIDPPTEIFRNGETQLWKITHNGVDTHAVHFHLFNVQVINRVGWDGAIKPPLPQELGWKDTVVMNPLEDVVVAATALKQNLPWTVPNSVRLLNPTMPQGSTVGFTGIDPYTNTPIVVTNEPYDYGWEYVWHCHLLGHEENDMMRPMVLRASFTAASDFNGDGFSDIFLLETLTGASNVWLMAGAAISSSGSPGAIPANSQIKGSGDFNGDGKVDVLWQDAAGTMTIWFMNGTTLSSSTIIGAVGSPWLISGVGDFNGDGMADILWYDPTTGTVAIWIMNGAVVSSIGIPGAVNTGWQISGVGDFNGDGKADILWQHTSGAVAVWFMNGSALTSIGWEGEMITTDWQFKGIGDFNGDGKADILWQHGPTGTVAIWIMNGALVTSVGVPGAISNPWSVKYVGDYNGDGKADILSEDSGTGTVALWFMNGSSISSVAVTGPVPSGWQIINK
jgi:FtsP/CotA-like multicopper oxidase with cupredoxin domain